MLPRLNPDPNALVDVQQTAFSHDFLGRWACSTWAEVSNNGGDPFDIVVIGAGMFGGYIADKLYRRAENIGLRVLVIEAGIVSSSHPRPEPAAPGFGRTGRASSYLKRARPRAAKSGLGAPLAQQSSVSGIGLLCRGEIVILGWMVAAPDGCRPGSATVE